ncbi:DNA polymerase delta subunit 3 [Mytilus galloprovincialis]|uniref:DNA polymerase delta subunit 3 n=1 Tax=Mytilus galloprovincialis TaxID=29158 RepID=A0A8B6HI38_MYTGA|nr:DNA polymerase delta subunit 3 [Mytilus galloprovincialis]
MGTIDEMYLDNLDEWVNDENQIVTFKKLSLELKVHVNKAKQMLYSFVQHQRNNKDNDHLFVTYFVAGLSHPVVGVKTVKCMVVPEENIEAFKSTLSVVTSSHIYSVGRSKVKDDNKLYLADYDLIHKDSTTNTDIFKFSSIKYPKAKLRSDTEVESQKRYKTEPTTTKQVNGSSKQNGENGHASQKPKQNGENSNVSQKPAAKPQKKGGIAGMFANQAKKMSPEKDTKNKTKSPEKDTKEVKEEDSKDSKKNAKESSNKKGGVMAFFSKQTAKANEKPPEPVKKDKIVKSEPEVKQETIKKEPSPAKRKVSDKGKGKRSKSGQDSDDDSQKKRRRIKAVLIDSSSEEEMDYESPIPSPVREPSPAPESPVPKEVEKESPEKHSPEKTTYTNNGEKKRKRRRKLVPKTFMDDEGYMVTEKVWEDVSTDASETEQPPPKKPQEKVTKSPQKKKASPKKKSPPSAGGRKQAALTNFFKKK